MKVTPKQILYRIGVMGVSAACIWAVVFSEYGVWNQMHPKEQPPAPPAISNDELLSGRRAETPSATLKAEQWPNAVPPGIIPDPEPSPTIQVDTPISWKDYAKAVEKWRGSSEGTYIQRQNLKKAFNEKYVGKRFVWKGYLDDVREGSGYVIGFFDRKGRGYMSFPNTATCVFDDTWRTELSNLEKGQKIIFAGNYEEYRLGASFRNCEIIEVE